MNKGRIGGIALVSATLREGERIFRALGNRRKCPVPVIPLYTGTIAGKPVVYGLSGIGKTNAAHAATLMQHYFSLSHIINFGIGGAYPGSGLSVGDIAVAEKEVYGDEGIAGTGGTEDLKALGIPLLKKGGKKYFNEFPFRSSQVSRTRKLAEVIGKDSGFQALSGPFVTVSACTGTMKKAVLDRKRFGAVCENMEGAAIAHICMIYGTPLIEVRGISNIVEDRDRRKWNIELASVNCQQVVMEMIRKNII